MIIAKATVFFTALAVATFSTISAEEISSSSDVVVEKDTAMPKTTKMPNNKANKKKKGGKAVHTKSGKKGKKSNSPSSSPTGVCEQPLVLRLAYDIVVIDNTIASYKELVSNDATLSQIPAVGIILDTATSVNAAAQSAMFSEATGCDYDASIELYNSQKSGDIQSSRRNLEEYICPWDRRKLQSDGIVEFGETAIRGFLRSVIFHDKLNTVYPLFMGLLGEITCAYYELSLAVVNLFLEISQNTIDLTDFHKGVLRCTVIEFEEGHSDIFFPDVFSIPTVFDKAACGL